MIYQEKFLYFQEALSGGSSDAVGADDVAMYSLIGNCNLLIKL